MASSDLLNFNKQITITLYDDEFKTKAFVIKCPATGRKPNIEISGQLLPFDTLSQIEIRLVNFYSSREKPFTHVIVSAGYANTQHVSFKGQITNIYDESPGPEKVTVIVCTTGNLARNLSQTVSLNLSAGYKLSNALSQVKKQAGFKDEIQYESNTQDLKTLTDKATLMFDGAPKDALHEIAQRFKDSVYITFSDEKIIVTAKNNKSTSHPGFINIPYLKAPLVLAGDTAVIKAPWDPAVRPFSWVRADTSQYKSKTILSAGIKREYYRVNSVDFNFSTITGNNSMTLQCYSPAAETKVSV